MCQVIYQRVISIDVRFFPSRRGHFSRPGEPNLVSVHALIMHRSPAQMLTRNSVLLVSKEMTTFMISPGEPRRYLVKRWKWEFLGHWKDPRSDEQDIGEKMKRTHSHLPRKLRIDGVSKLTRVRVRGTVLKNRSGVIRLLNEAISNHENVE
jgi:hypothetical protein